MRRALAVAVAVVLAAGVLAAVTHDEPDATDALTLDGPLRDRTVWALALLNDGSGEDELEEVLAAPFLAALPPERFREITEQQVRPLGPFTVERVVEASAWAATVRLRGGRGQALDLLIAIEAEPPHRVIGLMVRPAAGDPPSSWEEVDARLGALASDIAFLAAEVVDGECVPVHALEPDRVLALGSAFKLYVLGAAADAVAEGSASWDDEVEVRDDLRVHSSATYGDTPDGTRVSLRDLAAAMISVSDNTATDLVLLHVGRAAVEEQQSVLGMADPSRNIPFLTTRELSLLKWGPAADQRDAYLAADRVGREAMLASLPVRPATLADLDAEPGPRNVDTLEWFGSPSDLCRAHVGLQAKGEVVRSILAENPGLALDRRRWSHVAFKGGSEEGVLCTAWFAERDDGRVFVVAALLLDRERGIDSLAAVDVAGGAFALLELL